jgi:hypothetical protein
MQSKYSFKNRADFLVMTISGTYNYWDFIKYPKIIHNKCQKVGNYKVLIDVIPVSYSDIPTIELFFLGEIISEIISNKIKLAVVWKDDQDKFLGSVVSNRGVQMQIFNTIKSAENWLLQDTDPTLKKLSSNI